MALYALDQEGNRILATPGADGRCLSCKDRLIPRCGAIVSHHWAHYARPDCDPWGEPESEWHLSWKALMKREATEVVFGGGEHRADIVGNQGIVVELQHSPISPATIQDRELYYDNMIWLFDGSVFDKNFCWSDIKEIRSASTKARARRVSVHPNGYVSFRWLRASKALEYCQRPVFIDMGNGVILKVIHVSGAHVSWSQRDRYERSLREKYNLAVNNKFHSDFRRYKLPTPDRFSIKEGQTTVLAEIWSSSHFASEFLLDNMSGESMSISRKSKSRWIKAYYRSRRLFRVRDDLAESERFEKSNQERTERKREIKRRIADRAAALSVCVNQASRLIEMLQKWKLSLKMEVPTGIENQALRILERLKSSSNLESSKKVVEYMDAMVRATLIITSDMFDYTCHVEHLVEQIRKKSRVFVATRHARPIRVGDEEYVPIQVKQVIRSAFLPWRPNSYYTTAEKISREAHVHKGIAFMDTMPPSNSVDLVNGKLFIEGTLSSAMKKRSHFPTVRCSHCGSDMIFREGRRGTFRGCSSYPLCRRTVGAYPLFIDYLAGYLGTLSPPGTSVQEELLREEKTYAENIQRMRDQREKEIDTILDGMDV